MFGLKTSQSYHGKSYYSALVPLNRTDAAVRCVIIVHTQRLLIMLFSLLAQLFASCVNKYITINVAIVGGSVLIINAPWGIQHHLVADGLDVPFP
jgi:hypothetical protein